MKPFIRQVLTVANEQELESHGSQPLAASPYYPLLKLIAQVCDERAKGENVWLNVGTDKGQTSLLITLHQDGSRASAAGGNLVELADDCRNLL